MSPFPQWLGGCTWPVAYWQFCMQWVGYRARHVPSQPCLGCSHISGVDIAHHFGAQSPFLPSPPLTSRLLPSPPFSSFVPLTAGNWPLSPARSGEFSQWGPPKHPQYILSQGNVSGDNYFGSPNCPTEPKGATVQTTLCVGTYWHIGGACQVCVWHISHRC